MPRRAKKIDADQPDLVKRLLRAGYTVELDHDDILVGDIGLTLWVEVKSEGGKPTEGQLDIHKKFTGAYMIVGQWGVDHAFREITRWFARHR